MGFGQDLGVAPDPALALLRLQQLRFPLHLGQQGDRDVVQAALAPGFQVVGDGDDAGMVDDEARLLGHFPDGRRLEGLPQLQMAAGDGPVGGMASLALAEQHLALAVGEDDADPDAGIGSRHRGRSWL